MHNMLLDLFLTLLAGGDDCDWHNALGDGRLHHPALGPHCCIDCLTRLPAFRAYRESGRRSDLPAVVEKAVA